MVACDLLIDSLYHLHVNTNMNINEQVMNIVSQKRSKDKINQKYLWHHRLSHIGEDRINKIKNDGIFDSFSELYPACESCLQEKIAKLSFVRHEERTTEILNLVHINVCGPFDVQARGGLAISSSLLMICHGTDIYFL